MKVLKEINYTGSILHLTKTKTYIQIFKKPLKKRPQKRKSSMI